MKKDNSIQFLSAGISSYTKKQIPTCDFCKDDIENGMNIYWFGNNKSCEYCLDSVLHNLKLEWNKK